MSQQNIETNAETLYQHRVFESALRTIANVVFIFDIIHQRVTYANTMFSQQLGYTPEQIAAMGDQLLVALLHPEDLVHVHALLQKTARAADGETREMEYRLKKQDGGWRWYRLSATPFTRASSGKVEEVLAVSHDISASKQLETELRESQRLLQTVLDAIPVRLFWKDKDSTFLGCNQLVAQDAGLESPQAIVGLNDKMLFPDQAEIYRADDVAVMQSGAAKINFEEPLTTPTGEKIWLRTSKIPYKNTAGEVSGVIGTYEDITERKRAEEDLRTSETRYRAMLDIIPDLIFRTNRQGTFVTMKPTGDFNLPAEHYIGKSIGEFLPADATKTLVKTIGRTLDTRKSQTCEYLLTNDGEARYFEARMLASGEAEVLTMVRDITEEKLADAEREALQQQLLDAQKQALLELSTPIIPIFDQIIVMPLIGSIDTMRAQEITRALLRGITQHRAQVVIVDITGVAVVDSGVADHLNRTIQAARLKGAQTIITGISDAVAETIVDLGIDWSRIETLRDLQSGLMAAFARLGMRMGRAKKE